MDLTYAVIFYVAFGAAAFTLFVVLFRPKYKRTTEENRAKQKGLPDVHAPPVRVTQELIT